MSILIIISHILMFSSFIMLLVSVIQGHFFVTDGILKLQNFSIISILTYVFTQTFILFLIIAINKEIKNLITKNSVSINSKEYVKYKKKMHIHTSLNLLMIMTLAILFAAVHQEIIPLNIHRTFFVIVLVHYAYTIKIQYSCFKETIKLIVRLDDIIFTKL